MSLFITVYILSYLYHGFGITVGYHRLLSHRAFKCPTWLEYFIVSGGYLAFEGSPISWVATHRVHHRFTDEDGDPHRPKDGFWHAYAAWLFKPLVVLSPEQIEQVCPDLSRDPVYKFFDFDHTRKHALICLYACIAFRIAIGIWLGPWAVLANLLGAFTVFNAPFLVNSVCHLPEKGYKNFATTDDSRNVWWVGFLALGEGWHNNHHAVPQSARHGIRPFEIDISWWCIAVLKTLGLASNVRMPKEPKLAPCINPEFAKTLGSSERGNDSTDAGVEFTPDIPLVFTGRRSASDAVVASVAAVAASIAQTNSPSEASASETTATASATAASANSSSAHPATPGAKELMSSSRN